MAKMVFRASGSLADEMQKLERLRERDPESAANVVANGKLLLGFAERGNLRALQCALEHLEEDRVLLFYSVRMFRAACASRRLDVLRFMLAHGFDVAQVGAQDVLHSVVEGVEDELSAEAAQPLIRFLLDAGVDVNWQRKSDLFAALHIACRKSLFAIAHLLLIYGADVNAIAMHDEMPLTCAEQAAERINTVAQDQNRLLVALLETHNARRTWRRSDRRQNEQRRLETASSAPKVLSFSGSVSFQHTPEPTDGHLERNRTSAAVPAPAESEMLGAASRIAGIMLDTPEL